MTDPTTERQTDRTPARDGNGRYTRTPDAAGRDAEAVQLRCRGLSYRQIAADLGMSVSSVHDAVHRALAEIVREDVGQLRALELERLDSMEAAVWQVLERKHLTVSNGRVVYHEDEPLEDDAPVLHAVDRLLRIAERRARLLGLDQPVRVDVDAALRYEIVGVEVDRL